MDKQERFSAAKKVTLTGLLINIVLVVFKGFAGIIGRSQAVFADAVESFSDVIATSIVWFGLRAANKPSDFEHPYGHQKIETVSALVVGGVILISSFAITGNAIHTIATSQFESPGLIALIAAAATIIIKEGLFQYTSRTGKKTRNMAVTAIAWDHRKDAITTVATLIGVVGARAGLRILDPLAAILVAVVILRIGFSVSWGALNELIDISPSPEIMAHIRTTAENVEGVQSVKRFRARKAGPYIFVDMEIEIDQSMTVKQSHKTSEEVKERLHREMPDIRDIMVHVEPHPSHR